MNIPVPHGHLEAVIREPRGSVRAAAIVCHPHPLQGGTMHTKAVFRAAQALADVDIAALRFNFRGVGTSTGSYEEGVGERGDVTAALDWLEERYPGPAARGRGVFVRLNSRFGRRGSRGKGRRLFGLGLPIRWYDYSFLGKGDKPVLIIQGEEDEFGSGPEVEPVMAELGPHVTLVRIPGADHYFNGRIDEMKAAMSTYFESGPGRQVL